MQRVLVTGGAGYVGSTCCARLLERGFKVDVVDDLSTGHRESVPKGAEFHKLDIGDRQGMSELLASKPFYAVFHFAAKALISESVSNPGVFFDSNVATGVAMLEVLRQHGIRRFVFSSSAAVYGNPKSIPISEEHDKQPVNAYGESKLMLENVLRWYASAYGWSVFAFRYFNAAGGAKGWGECHVPETHIIPLLLQVASGRRESFEIFGTDYDTSDGTCIRDYVHVVDIAEAHLLALGAMESAGFRPYNIGTGAGYSVRQVCDAVAAVTGKQLLVKTGSRRPGDPAVLCADPRRLMQEFGWTPRHSLLHEIIQGAWQWELRHDERSHHAQAVRASA